MSLVPLWSWFAVTAVTIERHDSQVPPQGAATGQIIAAFSCDVFLQICHEDWMDINQGFQTSLLDMYARVFDMMFNREMILEIDARTILSATIKQFIFWKTMISCHGSKIEQTMNAPFVGPRGGSWSSMSGLSTTGGEKTAI